MECFCWITVFIAFYCLPHVWCLIGDKLLNVGPLSKLIGCAVSPRTCSMGFESYCLTCPELLKSGDLGLCKYGEKCSFAFNQLEIDVWTEERKGTLDRNLLFDTAAVKLDPVNSIIRLLQEHKGLFIFLCQVSSLNNNHYHKTIRDDLHQLIF